jgi:hypothetical protein
MPFTERWGDLLYAATRNNVASWRCSPKGPSILSLWSPVEFPAPTWYYATISVSIRY